MQDRGEMGGHSDIDKTDIAETHNLSPRQSDRQTVSTRLTAPQTTDIQTVLPRLATGERAVAPMQFAEMESRLHKGFIS